MKISKKIIALVLVLSLVLILGACTPAGTDEPDPETTSSDVRAVKTQVAVQKGSLGIGIAKLKADRAYAYDVSYLETGEEVEKRIIDGSADIAVLPIDRAVSIYNQTDGGVRIIAINTLGSLQVLERGSKEITEPGMLSGKKVYTSGKGTLEDAVIRSILSENGVKEDVLEYTETYDELVALAKEGKADVCIMPEPYVTDLRYATNPVVKENESRTPEQEAEIEAQFPTENRWKKVLNISKLWKEAQGEELAYGCVVARTEYIAENPEIISEFLIFNEVSINWLGVSEDSLGLLLEEKMYSDYAIASASYNSSNIKYIEGKEMKAAVEKTLSVLSSAAPELFGTEQPADICYIA